MWSLACQSPGCVTISQARATVFCCPGLGVGRGEACFAEALKCWLISPCLSPDNQIPFWFYFVFLSPLVLCLNLHWQNLLGAVPWGPFFETFIGLDHYSFLKSRLLLCPAAPNFLQASITSCSKLLKIPLTVNFWMRSSHFSSSCLLVPS